MKIITMQAENIKRLRAVQFNPKADGVTSIGGRNGQGKTTVLDTILALVKGGAALPSDAIHDGEEKGGASITLDNGATVTMILKTGKDGSTKRTLKVDGGPVNGSPQSVCDALFGKQALDVSGILRASDKDRRDLILKTIGSSDDLATMDAAIKSAYEDRAVARKIYDKTVADVDHNKDANDIPNVNELEHELEQAQDAHEAHCAERGKLLAVEAEAEGMNDKIKSVEAMIDRGVDRIERLKAEMKEVQAQLETDNATRRQLLGDKLRIGSAESWKLEEINNNANQALNRVGDLEQLLTQRKRFDEAIATRNMAHIEFRSSENRLETLRRNREELIQSIPWPLAGMSLTEDMEFCFNGKRWDCMSGAERYKVAAAIQSAITPDCKILLCDGMEQLDDASLADLNGWAEQQGVQIIGTRVTSDPNETAIFIEDGLIVNQEN